MTFINPRIKKAFTMAEAILVMTILGIIAAIMITTLKPAAFKEKGLKVLAKKVLSEIDTATTQILVNDAKMGTMTSLALTDGAQFEFKGNPNKVINLYKKYLVTVRTPVVADSFCVTGKVADTDPSRNAIAVYFKDGGCLGVYANQVDTASPTIFPGESATTAVTTSQGLLLFDINSEEEPNIIGVDRFILPIIETGIGYDLADGSALPSPTPTPSEPEDVDCDMLKANCENYRGMIVGYATPAFCTTLPGTWVYKSGETTCYGTTYYFDTQEQYNSIPHCTGSVADPSCYNAECDVVISTSGACPIRVPGM